MAKKEHLYEFTKRIYNAFPDEKAVGLFEMRSPVVLIRDPQLLKYLTVKVFDHFMNHKPFIQEDTDPLFGNMLSVLSGQKWKDMRATLSPAFTGSKMRLMLQLINQVTEGLVEHLHSECDKTPALVCDMKDLISRYTNDVIALCAFGITVDSQKDRENKFYTTGRDLMEFGGTKGMIKFMLNKYLPKFCKTFNITLMTPSTRKFFTDVVMDTMEYREKNNIFIPDMVSLLMDAKKGTLQHSAASAHQLDDAKSEGFATVNESEMGKQTTKRQWTDDEIIAQCFVFFIGGFENNSTVMTIAAYELALNLDVQEKLFEEVMEMKENLQGERITYEELHGMRYLDGVVCETLRKWPPAAFTDRICNQAFDYKDEETGLEMKFEKGNSFWIPIYGYHMDPKYFPRPEKFDPERFSEANRSEINADAYLPFGIGPRVCPANRFVLMAVKAFLFYMLQDFEFRVTEKTPIPLKPRKDFTSIAKDVFLEVKRR